MELSDASLAGYLSSWYPSAMSVCVSCKDPLVLGTDEDEMEDGNNAPVPDDLSLPCGCHFHW